MPSKKKSDAVKAVTRTCTFLRRQEDRLYFEVYGLHQSALELIKAEGERRTTKAELLAGQLATEIAETEELCRSMLRNLKKLQSLTLSNYDITDA